MDNFREGFAKRIRVYVVSLIEFIDGLPKERVANVIANQLIRSGTSIGANYFEAKSASSRKDFINFFTYSLKSANESRFWLETLIDIKRCDFEKAQFLIRETIEIANVVGASILTMKKKAVTAKL